jgi:integrase
MEAVLAAARSDTLPVARSEVANVRDLLEVWLAAFMDRADVADLTKVAKRTSAKRLARSTLRHVRTDDLARRHLEAHRDAELRAGRAASTVRLDLGILGQAWRWGREEQVVPERALPSVRVQRGAAVYSRATPSTDDAFAVLDHLRGREPAWPYRAVLLLLYTGARKAEVCAARWSDLRGDLLELTGKTGSRVVPLPESVAREVRTWPRDAETIVAGPPSAPNVLHHVLARATRDLGIPTFAPHGFRRAAVDALYSQGVDIAVAAALLGHSPETALQHYRQVSEAQLRAAALRVAPVRKPVQLAEVDAKEGEDGGQRKAQE